jgi:hypothetical protein
VRTHAWSTKGWSPKICDWIVKGVNPAVDGGSCSFSCPFQTWKCIQMPAMQDTVANPKNNDQDAMKLAGRIPSTYSCNCIVKGQAKCRAPCRAPGGGRSFLSLPADRLILACCPAQSVRADQARAPWLAAAGPRAADAAAGVAPPAATVTAAGPGPWPPRAARAAGNHDSSWPGGGSEPTLTRSLRPTARTGEPRRRGRATDSESPSRPGPGSLRPGPRPPRRPVAP